MLSDLAKMLAMLEGTAPAEASPKPTKADPQPEAEGPGQGQTQQPQRQAQGRQEGPSSSVQSVHQAESPAQPPQDARKAPETA